MTLILQYTLLAVCPFEQTAKSQIIFQSLFSDKLSEGGKLNYSAEVSAGASAGFSAEGIAAGNSGAGASISIFSV